MAKNYEYKKATIADIDELVRTRIIVLRTANKLSYPHGCSKRIFDKFHLKMGFAEANRIICFTKRLTDLEE